MIAFVWTNVERRCHGYTKGAPWFRLFAQMGACAVVHRDEVCVVEDGTYQDGR